MLFVGFFLISERDFKLILSSLLHYFNVYSPDVVFQEIEKCSFIILHSDVYYK